MKYKNWDRKKIIQKKFPYLEKNTKMVRFLGHLFILLSAYPNKKNETKYLNFELVCISQHSYK